jgi:hypothetical protein
MLRVAGGLFLEKQLRSGRKHREIAGNLSLYCPSILGSMPRMDDQYMGVGTGMSNFEHIGSWLGSDVNPAEKAYCWLCSKFVSKLA